MQARVLHLLDLPGFGFAKLSKAEREKLAAWTVLYVQSDRNLKMIWLLNDSRRTPQIDELALQKVAFEAGVKLQIGLTKTDKLNKNDARKMQNELATAYDVEPDDLVVAGEGFSVEPAWQRILNALDS